MQTRYWECDCQSFEHVLRFCYDEEDIVTINKPEVREILGMEEGENQYPIWEDVYLEVYLNSHLNFFQRIIPAIKYLFTGHAGRFKYSDCATISRERLPELISFLEEIRDYKRPEEEK